MVRREPRPRATMRVIPLVVLVVARFVRTCRVTAITGQSLHTAAVSAMPQGVCVPSALRVLRDLAVIGEQTRELQAAVRPVAENGYAEASNFGAIATALDGRAASIADSLKELTANMQDNTAAGAPEAKAASQLVDTDQPVTLLSLRQDASKLHRQVQEQRQVILLLEEQESGDEERTRAAFDQIDINGDGELQWEEFKEAAAALLAVGKAQNPVYQQELRGQFARADSDGSSSLSYQEFVALMASLRGDALGPLRAAFTDGLRVWRVCKFTTLSMRSHFSFACDPCT